MSVLIGVSGSSDDSSSSPPPCIFNKDPLAPDIVLRPSDGDNPGSTVTKSFFSNFFKNVFQIFFHFFFEEYGVLQFDSNDHMKSTEMK